MSALKKKLAFMEDLNMSALKEEGFISQGARKPEL